VSGLLRAVGEIACFFLAPVIVVKAQIALFQLIAKVGEIEADQGCFEGWFTETENRISAATQEAGYGRNPRFRRQHADLGPKSAAPIVPIP
jgi:hypothetical protein